MKLVTASEMRELDRRAIQDLGIPSLVLMENAGRTTYRILRREFPGLPGEVAVVAGRGNNGGDGFVVARYLANAGIPVAVFLLGPRDRVSGDARVNLEILAHLGIAVAEVLTEADLNPVIHRLAKAGLIVDALLGTGLNAPVQGLMAALIERAQPSAGAGVGGGYPHGAVRRYRGSAGGGPEGPGDRDLRLAQARPGAAAGPGLRGPPLAGGYRHPPDSRPGGDGFAGRSRGNAGLAAAPAFRQPQGKLRAPARPGRVRGQDRGRGPGSRGGAPGRGRAGDPGGPRQSQRHPGSEAHRGHDPAPARGGGGPGPGSGGLGAHRGVP